MDAVESAEVNQHINQSIEIGDGLLVTEFRAFDAELFSLGIDAFTGGTLVVKGFVIITLTVELVAEASTLNNKD